ncbi:MAG: DCC1-like thiol-disulfide oxidoreductase family protein [Xanthobacteraceae bacterium]|nr:DCC1-like thiol-disulfide oxidoreductase family protein [Xanthobacteraceae bacterium]
MQQSWESKVIDGVPDGLVVFDGVCVLCSGWVQFLLERDNADFFRFTPIQSRYGRALAQRLGIDPESPETNAVILGGRAYFKADSAIRALTHVPRWRWVRVFSIVPRRLRDWLYDRVARNRYRLFGRTESCMVPTPELMRRFVFDEGGANSERALP